MTDYLKGSSDSGSKYEMKETKKFPTENGGMKKGIRKNIHHQMLLTNILTLFLIRDKLTWFMMKSNLMMKKLKVN